MDAGKSTYVVSGGYDSVVTIAAISSNAPIKKVQSISLRDSQVNRIVISPDNRIGLASFKVIYLYSLRVNSVGSHWSFDANVTDIAFDGPTMFCCGEDKTVHIINTTERDHVIARHIGSSGFNSLSLCIPQSLLLTCNENGEIVMLSACNLEEKCPAKRIAPCPIRSIALDSERMKLIAARHDGNVSILGLTESGTREESTFTAHSKLVLRTKMSPDSSLFVTTSGDSTGKLWDPRTLECVRVLKEPDQAKWLWDADFSDDSKILCTGGTDGVCRVWDVGTGEVIMRSTTHKKGVNCVALMTLP